jgi:hypothetical protein
MATPKVPTQPLPQIMPDDRRQQLQPAATMVVLAVAEHRGGPQNRPVSYALALDFRIKGECGLTAHRKTAFGTWRKPGGSPMRLNARRSRDGVIIATLAGALACHGLAADPGVAAEHVASVLNAPGLTLESEQWLRQ